MASVHQTLDQTRDIDTITKVIEKVTGGLGLELKKEQMQVIHNFVEGKDIFVSLPTGYGKSLCYLLLPKVFNAFYMKEKSMVLVVSPLISLMKDQVDTCHKLGLKGIALTGDTSDSVHDILCNDVQVVYTSPEKMIASKRWRQFLRSSTEFHCRLCAVIVDEAHCVPKWGEEFRDCYKRVGELRSLVPSNINMMALTATASKSLRTECCNMLGMVNYITIQVSPEKSNISYACLEYHDISFFEKIASKLKEERTNMGRMIIFCKRRDICHQLFSFFLYHLKSQFTEPVGSSVDNPRCRLVDMFTSGTQVEVKSAILESFKTDNSPLRIVIATIAFGLGIDSPNIRYIVHLGPPADLESYIQQVGRAGRDYNASCALLLFGKGLMNNVSDYLKIYCSLQTCRRNFLFKDFECFEVSKAIGCLCCDICQKMCTCGNCHSSSNLLNFFK